MRDASSLDGMDAIYYVTEEESEWKDMIWNIFVQEHTWNIKCTRIGIVECAIARWREHRVPKKSSHVFFFDRKKNRRKSEGLRDDNANFTGVKERRRRTIRHKPRIYIQQMVRTGRIIHLLDAVRREGTEMKSEEKKEHRKCGDRSAQTVNKNGFLFSSPLWRRKTRDVIVANRTAWSVLAQVLYR